MEKSKIPIGISSCLVGQEVRHNGAHTRDRYITDTLSQYLDWIPVCPEVEMGLGIPRETLRLVRKDEDIRFVESKSGRDHTDNMNSFSKSRLMDADLQDIRGYILKKDSPSCGMMRVKVYDHNKVPSRTGVGLYAQALLNAFPNLPVEEEGRLRDYRLRENFITRVFTFDRWLKIKANSPKPNNLVKFHTAHKMLFLSHNQSRTRFLGKIVAKAGSNNFEQLIGEYENEMMQTLKRPASVKNNVNVLQHLMGYLKKKLNLAEKAELLNVIDDYHKDFTPLSTPITLIHHHLKKLDNEWIEAQLYLEPYPKELALRKFV